MRKGDKKQPSRLVEGAKKTANAWAKDDEKHLKHRKLTQRKAHM